MGWREKETAKLAGKKVLMVGAGGIGCELLKNLVLSGFRDIHVIDLDTIDVSNLNRQFLFRKEHVGKPKSEIATLAARKMCPSANVTFDHDSIFSEKFNYEFFKQYALVFNALDNRNARNHVNRMCISSRIPLIDGGTAGYLGQVVPIVRGMTECFECQPKPENVKSFPGCTIRNTPSEHIHCTVWAKHVFNQLFGELDIDDDVSPDMEDEDAKGGEDGSANMDTEENGAVKEPEDAPGNTRAMAEQSGYDPVKIFNKLFNDDIHYLLKMENLWKERRAPEPAQFELLPYANAGMSSEMAEDAARLDPHQRILSPAESGDEFCRAVEALAKRKGETSDGILSWDKDDDDGMRFVAACANIRAEIFHISPKSLFEIKSMAGNIIPAIATTNAIIAGVMAVEALKIIGNDLDSIAAVTLNSFVNLKGQLLVPQLGKNFFPNKNCYTCSARREVAVRVNVDAMSVRTLRDKVLKEALGVTEPDATEAASNKIIISSEEGELDDLLDDKLSKHGLSMGGRLLVEDFDSNEKLRLVVLQAAEFGEEEFVVVADEKPEPEPETKEESPTETTVGKKRRTLEDDEEKETPSKKARFDDEVDGAIV